MPTSRQALRDVEKLKKKRGEKIFIQGGSAAVCFFPPVVELVDLMQGVGPTMGLVDLRDSTMREVELFWGLL